MWSSPDLRDAPARSRLLRPLFGSRGSSHESRPPIVRRKRAQPQKQTPMQRRLLIQRKSTSGPPRSVIAVPDRAYLDAGTRATSTAAPLSAQTSLAKSIMAVPAAGPTPACPVIAMNLDHAATQAISRGAHIRRGGTSRGSHCDQEACNGQSLHSSHHFAPLWAATKMRV